MNGPPTKSTAEWKRVWAIRKYNAKKKLVQNKKSLHKTGGGPFAEQPLNSQEEVIIQASGIQASVSGIQGATSFGCDEEEFEEEFLELTEVEAMQPEPQGQAEQPSDRQPTNNNRPTPNKKKDSSSSKQIELALKQVELQEEFIKIQNTKLEYIHESLKDINCTLVELKECAKLLCIEKQKDSELKKEELVLKRMELELAKAMRDMRLCGQ